MRRLIQEWSTLGSAEFARVRGRKASNKVRARYHKLAGTPVVPSRYNVMMTANWSDTTFRFCIDAAYGFDLHDILRDYPEPYTFLDIGANQGVYSLIAGKNSNCKAAYAFEPMTATFDLLSKNIHANELQNKVIAINAGISDKTGSATLTIDPTHSGGATLHGNSAKTEQRTVDVKLIEHQELGDQVTAIGDVVVKVDVEGHEETVFEQLIQCNFADKIKLVHYEVDEKWIKPERLQGLLEQSGFTDFTRYNTLRNFHYDVVARRSPA